MSASSWQAVWLLAVEVGAVVLLTLLITWRLRSVVWQRTLWQASLIALIGLLVVEFSAVSFPRGEHEEAPVIQVTAEDWPVQSIAPSIEITDEFPVDYQTASQMTVIEAMPVKTAKSISSLLLAIALGIWVIGSVVLAGRLLMGRFLLLRFCARSRMVTDEELRQRVQGMALKLGMDRSVQVLETAHIQTPVVFGLFHPIIALPTGFTERFDSRQQEAILGHELAHLAARDPLWYLLADALVSLLWWHPLVWVARSRLQVASELAADEACVLAEQGPETLAECLVSIAKEMHGPGALESIGIEGSGFRSRLGQRVERLLQLSAEMVSKPALWRIRLVKLGAPVLLLSLLIVGTGWMRKDGSAPWSGVVNGAWDTAVGAVRVEEEVIRRDPRPRLVAETKVETILATNGEPPKAERLPTLSPQERRNLYIRIGKVNTNAFFKELEKKTGEKLDLKVEGDEGHYSYSSINLNRLLQQYFAAAGLDCEVNGPDAGGTRVSFNPALGDLWVRGTSEEVEVTRKLVQPLLTASLPAPNPYMRTNGVQGKMPLRNLILVKLNQIVIKELHFEGKPLEDVVQFLQEESVKLDPEKKGVNFIINSNLDDQAANGAKTNSTKVDLEKAVITINPPLKNLRMIDALDVITKVASGTRGQALAFMVEDYAVVFRQRVIEPPQLFTRIFKVDTERFVNGLEKEVGRKVMPLATNVTVDGKTNVLWGTVNTNISAGLADKIQAMGRQYFSDLGVDMTVKEKDIASTQIFFNDRTGVLMVRATLADLELIQTKMREFGTASQVIEPKAAELPKLPLLMTQIFPLRFVAATNAVSAIQGAFTDNRAKVVADNQANKIVVTAVAEDLKEVEKIIQKFDMAPQQVVIEVKYIEVSDKAAKEMGLTWFTSGPLNGTNTVKLDQLSNPTIPTNQNVRVEAPVLPNYVSVLSLAQAQALVKRFESQDGSDVLSAPRVTTLSNRQARIEVSNKMDIVVKKQINAGAGPAGDDQTVFQTSSVSTGPALEVLPKVAADGLSLQLDWMVCITEFVGYDKPAKGMDENEPLPRFRVRQVANSSVVRDGQALLMGCGTSEVKKQKKGIFRSGSQVEKRHVIVMLTPRVIDAAGNLVNPGK